MSLISALLLVVLVVGACTPAPAPPQKGTPGTQPGGVTPTSQPSGPQPSTPGGNTVSVLGAATYSSDKLVSWYVSKGLVPASTSDTPPVGGQPYSANACATLRELAALYIEEGAAEGVRGDLAFIQAMIETGWLKHSARVPASFCNYSGLGAVDNGASAIDFPDARTGVRAQIQHLRAYADATTTCSNFRYPNVDQRCKWVTKGSAPTWNEMGNGRWATDPNYASKVLSLWANLEAFVG